MIGVEGLAIRVPRMAPSGNLPKDSDSPDPEPSRAGLFGGHHVRKWFPAKHRRPQALLAMTADVRRNACKMLAESSARLHPPIRRVLSGPKVGRVLPTPSWLQSQEGDPSGLCHSEVRIGTHDRSDPMRLTTELSYDT